MAAVTTAPMAPARQQRADEAAAGEPLDISGSTLSAPDVPEGLVLHRRRRPWITELVEQAKPNCSQPKRRWRSPSNSMGKILCS